jgi:hypothetical protein
MGLTWLAWLTGFGIADSPKIVVVNGKGTAKPKVVVAEQRVSPQVLICLSLLV